MLRKSRINLKKNLKLLNGTQRDELLLALSNDKWRPQDRACDVQLAMPFLPFFPPLAARFFSLHLRSVEPLPTSGAGRARQRFILRTLWRKSGSSVCLLLTFNQQNPNYCSSRIHASPVIAICPALSYFRTLSSICSPPVTPATFLFNSLYFERALF